MMEARLDLDVETENENENENDISENFQKVYAAQPHGRYPVAVTVVVAITSISSP